MQLDLFDGATPARRELAPGAWWLGGFALDLEAALAEALEAIAAAAPFRHMKTPGNKEMSAAMTNCGAWGWVSDARGYRYEACDPVSGRPWPKMPAVIADLAARAAAAVGFGAFDPDACLVNRYAPGARMGPHRDADEVDFSQPIVSVSLGLPAVFRWGGPTRGGRMLRVPLTSGDVVVFGGPSRRCYHAVSPIAEGSHARFGRARLNLTLRRAR